MKGVRLPELDAMKALGALFVLLYHSQALAYGTDAELPVIWLRSLLATCCPLFFFVSGALALRGEGLRIQRSARSAAKLFFLSLFWSTVSYPVLQVQHGGEVKLGEWVSGVLTQELWRTNVFWFLPVLAMLQLARPVVRTIHDSNPKLFRYLLVGACMVAFGYDALSRILQTVGWMSGSGAPMKLVGFINLFRPLQGYFAWALGYYLLGMWATERKMGGKLSSMRSVVALMLGTLALALDGLLSAHFTGVVPDVTFGGYDYIGTAVATVALYSLLTKACACAGVAKMGRLVGENALAVYVIPWFITYPLAQWVLSRQTVVERLIVALPVCLVIMVIAALLGRLFAKMRVGRFLLSA